eukprot:364165-Chlamydomonas_euryale.AAC.9
MLQPTFTAGLLGLVGLPALSSADDLMRAASQANRQGRLPNSREPSRRPAGLFSRTPNTH